MTRIEKIKIIIELHNFYVIEWNKSYSRDIKNDSLWDLQLVDLNTDRYYLIESLKAKSWNLEDDIKTYEPATEVRYLLRSKEANKYGKGHDAFYKRYLSTISIENKYLDNPQLYKDELLIELNKRVSI